MRSRLVIATALSKLRLNLRLDSAVSWWTMTSGRAARTASRTAAASSGSSTTGSPTARRRPGGCGGSDHVVAALHELGDEAAAQSAGRAGDEDA